MKKVFFLLIFMSSYVYAIDWNSMRKVVDFSILELNESHNSRVVSAVVNFRAKRKICDVLKNYVDVANDQLGNSLSIDVNQCASESADSSKIFIKLEMLLLTNEKCSNSQFFVVDFTDYRPYKTLKDTYREEEAQFFLYSLFDALGFNIFFSQNYSKYNKRHFSNQITINTCVFNSH